MPETQFTQVQYTLQGLMNQIQMEQIGLPDIQRPFVWEGEIHVDTAWARL